MHLNIDSMPIVPLFLLKLSISLAVVWCFYQLVLRRLTFHLLNRWYLLGYALLSFVFPLINIEPILQDRPGGEPVVLQFIPAMGSVARGGAGAVAAVSSGPATFPVWTAVLYVLAAGSALLAVRVALRWVSLVRLRRRGRMIGGNGVKIYQVDGPVIPFSFGNAIFINQHLHTEKEWEDIILHEYVHIRQKHTIDILVAELICIVNWYNPFVWLIRYSIRQNLEFIADQQVLDKGVDRKEYQYHLLKVMGEPRYRLANSFNFASLKKRIVMMNQLRSAKLHLLRLLFLVPLVAVLLVAFREKYVGFLGSHGPVYVNAAGIVINVVDRKPLEGVMVRDQVTGLSTTTDVNGYYKLKVPVPGKSVTIRLDFTKPRYDTDFRERNIPKLEGTIGILDIGILRLRDVPRVKGVGLFLVPIFEAVPADPGYADAVRELKAELKENDDLNRFMKLEKHHPEIGLFYRTEDGRKEIVIYLDGRIERYGYPGTPALPELYKKYGEMPGYFASDHPEHVATNAGYLARWAAIGEQAQREFHPTGANVRAVIFPGDSRVIGVPVSGKPQVYDMDNADPRERPAFEELYGKLPEVVPPSGNPSHFMEMPVVKPKDALRQGPRDTVPGGRRDSLRGGGRRDSLRGASVGATKLYLDSARHQRPLFLVDGREVSQDSLNNLYPDQIESMTVLKDSVTLEKYGEKGKGGVILIELKNPGGQHVTPQRSEDQGIRRPVTLSLPWKPDSQTIWVVGGREEPIDSLRTLNPDRIKSIQVLKDSAATQLYGERGRNGVVIVTLKQVLP